MSNFEFIDNIHSTFYQDWNDSEKFISKGRIIGENGKPISSNYKGTRYRLLSKKERNFTCFMEKMKHVAWGICKGLVNKNFATLLKSVKLLFSQEEKLKIRLAVAVPQSSSTQKTEPIKPPINDIKISDDTISGVSRFITKNIKEGILEEGNESYFCQQSHLVFTLKSEPNYIFKTKLPGYFALGVADDSMTARYKKIIEAQKICQTYELGLLVIPKATIFLVQIGDENYEVIAEEKLNLDPRKCFTGDDFEKHAPDLNETIRQLAVFICKTGYCDVDFRNNPVLDNDKDDYGCRQIGLIDLEELESPEIGLFGNSHRRGLVGCVTVEQGKIVEKVAKENGISTRLFAAAHAKRKEEIELESKKTM